MNARAVRLRPLDQFFAAYVLAALAMLTFIIWGILDDTRKAIHDAASDAMAHVQVSSEAMALEIGAYRHEAQLMVREKQDLFNALLAAPDPDGHLFTLAELTAAWFPKALAFTVGNAQGAPLLSDFKGSIGQACLDDMKASAAQTAPLVPLHGLSSIPHFDINIPLHGTDGQRGVFLVTFGTDKLASHLNRHSDSRFILELGTPHDLEAPGARPGHNLPKPAFQRQVEGTRIVVHGHIRPEFLAQQSDLRFFRLLAFAGGFGLFAGLGGWMLWRSRQGIRRDSDVLREVNLALYDQSLLDPLTGLANRRHLEERISPVLRQRQREGGNLCLALLDVDHFKRINDELGHDAGDACLRQLADILRARTQRPFDAAIRIGGEEFLVCWDDTDLHQGVKLASDIQHDLRHAPFKHGDGADVTVSIGLRAVTRDCAAPLSTLMREADQALYRAKQGGRDRIEIAAQVQVPATAQGENQA